jgi:hypothetical protein
MELCSGRIADIFQRNSYAIQLHTVHSLYLGYAGGAAGPFNVGLVEVGLV